MQVCKCASMQMCKDANVQGCQCARMQMCICASMQECQPMQSLNVSQFFSVSTRLVAIGLVVNKSRGRVKGVAHKQVQMGTKWSKIEFLANWQEMAGQWGKNSLK